MGLGAFAGGLAVGIERGAKANAERERLQMDKENHEWTKSERQRQRDHENDIAAATQRWFGQDGNAAPADNGPNSAINTDAKTGTTTMTGPLDARDAQAGTMDGATTQVQTQPQGGQAQPQAQPQAQGGVNPFAKGNENKLLGYMADVFRADAKYGKVDPAKMKELISYRQQFEKDGSLEALAKYATSGNPTDLAPLADRFGADPASLNVATKKNQWGMPTVMLSGTTKDGQPFENDMGLAASLLGLDGYGKAIDTKHDNDRQDRQSQVLDDYYKGRVGAMNARAKAAGAKGDGYDADLIQKLVDKNETHYSKQSGNIGPDGKRVKDDWANNKTAMLAFEFADRGMTETEAVRKARAVVDKITTQVDRQDDWSKRSKFGPDDIGYDGVRDSFLQQFMGGGNRQAPAAAPAGNPNPGNAAIPRPAATAPAAAAAPQMVPNPMQAQNPAAVPAQPSTAIQRPAAPARKSVASIVGTSGDATLNRIQAPKIAQVDALAANLNNQRDAIRTAVQTGDQRQIIAATEEAKKAYIQLQTLVQHNFPQDADRIMSSMN